jgi:hypothetical protein
MRIYDKEIITNVINGLLGLDNNVNIDKWINDPANIVLVNDRGDVAVFEIGFRHVYSGHYWFKSRGRAAIRAASEFLDELFNTCYNIPVLIGLVPLTHLGARWLSRQVGFKSYGIEHIDNKPYELFIITKKEFNRE